MNEAHTNAVLAALEGQRNNALNGLVNTEAALTIARARITELEKRVTELSVRPAEVQPA
jgi:hypothetical protein